MNANLPGVDKLPPTQRLLVTKHQLFAFANTLNGSTQ